MTQIYRHVYIISLYTGAHAHVNVHAIHACMVAFFMLLSSLDFTFKRHKSCQSFLERNIHHFLMQDVGDLQNNLPECHPLTVYMSFVQEASCMAVFPQSLI